MPIRGTSPNTAPPPSVRILGIFPRPSGSQRHKFPIPWRAGFVFDRAETRYSEWVAHRVAATAHNQLLFDKAHQLPYHIKPWSEKTLPDYIPIRDRGRLAAEFGCDVVVVGEDDLPLTVASELAQRIKRTGRPVVILYLADFDPKGFDRDINESHHK